jgi:hypothetical protein
MKMQRFLLVLTLLNLAILIGTVAERRAAAAGDTLPVLRGRALQIVDDSGKVRASIAVLPPSRQENGEVSAETVLLRLTECHSPVPDHQAVRIRPALAGAL